MLRFSIGPNNNQMQIIDATIKIRKAPKDDVTAAWLYVNRESDPTANENIKDLAAAIALIDSVPKEQLAELEPLIQQRITGTTATRRSNRFLR